MAEQLTEVLNYFLEEYVSGKKEKNGKDAAAWKAVCDDAPKKVYQTSLVDADKYLVTGSVGKGVWADVPWLGIFRKEITTSAQRGVYIVYLLSSDGSSIYLTFNQGVVDIQKELGVKKATQKMRERAEECIEKLNKRSFYSDNNISLGNKITPLAGMYQRGTIFYKEYKKRNLPSEEVLRKDLNDMLEIYEEYYDKIFNKSQNNDSVEPSLKKEVLVKNENMNIIFFGAPGTGKSYKVNSLLPNESVWNLTGEERKNLFLCSEIAKKDHYAEVLSNEAKVGGNIWNINECSLLESKLPEVDSEDNVKNPEHSALLAYIKFLKEYKFEQKVFRTTFHPDYDYAQFVGAYKPKKDDKDEKITYAFIPQVFAKAYVTAWKLYFSAGNASTAENQVYLVIEEINRGNCAQIFGDIFQLLDRSNEDDEKGFSQYSIDADCDFAEWLKKYSDLSLDSFWAEYTKKLGGEGKLKLPPNLNILATMNTSDQSLFPMDSAFKRRFDWEYVPISFDGKEAAKYEIDVRDSEGNRYLWKDFVENVNKRILDLTDSEDKQLGEFFIKPDDGMVISKERFLGKVMFYLWNEVCKDEHKNGSFFQAKDESGKVNYFTFQDLYRDKGLLKRFMDELLKKDA